VECCLSETPGLILLYSERCCAAVTEVTPSPAGIRGRALSEVVRSATLPLPCKPESRAALSMVTQLTAQLRAANQTVWQRELNGVPGGKF